jgi:hypothetical protein
LHDLQAFFSQHAPNIAPAVQRSATKRSFFMVSPFLGYVTSFFCRPTMSIMTKLHQKKQ